MGTLAWSDPIRARRSVHRQDGGHLGYITTIDYPNRDITALTEGSPYREIVISDPRKRRIALLRHTRHTGWCSAAAVTRPPIAAATSMRIRA